MLQEERDFFQEKLGEWLPQYAGQFVLIRGRALVGRYATIDEALADGARRFGLVPMLVRRVEAVSDDVSAPALALGLIDADPQPAAWR